MLVQSGCADAVSNADQLDEAARQAHALDGATVRAALQTLQELLPPARLQLLQDALDAFDFDAARLQLDGLRELMEKETA